MEEANELSLREFVKKALIDINEGICDAQDEGVNLVYSSNSGMPMPKPVEFDVAVSTSNTNSRASGGSAALSISVIDLGYRRKKQKGATEDRQNRIKFSVEIFPGSRNQLKKSE